MYLKKMWFYNYYSISITHLGGGGGGINLSAVGLVLFFFNNQTLSKNKTAFCEPTRQLKKTTTKKVRKMINQITTITTTKNVI